MLQVEIREERREGRRNSGGQRGGAGKCTPLALPEILQELGKEVQEMLGNS